MGFFKKPKPFVFEYTPPKWSPLPPIPPSLGANLVKSQMKEMLFACLRGGMSYEDAKDACAREYGDSLAIAKEMDDARISFYDRQMKEWVATLDSLEKETSENGN